MEKNYIVIYITSKNEDEALALGKGLVAKKLAACANIIGPVRSIYRWKGKQYDEKEVLLLLKSKSELFDKIKQYVVENHSYEVPEIISVPITTGLHSYLSWIDENTI